jgi:hypothetical protein
MCKEGIAPSAMGQREHAEGMYVLMRAIKVRSFIDASNAGEGTQV